jgi:uncharacterized protein (TIGR03435 family)
MFRSTFRLEISRADVQRDVLVMRKVSGQAPGLTAARNPKRGGGGEELGGLKLDTGSLGWTTSYLEKWLGKPVINETGDTNRYDIRLHWKLSPAEKLVAGMDRKLMSFVSEPDPEREKKLAPEQLKLIAAFRGELSADEIAAFPADERERIQVFRSEMAKAEDKRFAPDPEAVRQAVFDQWGVKLEPDRRMLPGLVVRSVKE